MKKLLLLLALLPSPALAQSQSPAYPCDLPEVIELAATDATIARGAWRPADIVFLGQVPGETALRCEVTVQLDFLLLMERAPKDIGSSREEVGLAVTGYLAKIGRIDLMKEFVRGKIDFAQIPPGWWQNRVSYTVHETADKKWYVRVTGVREMPVLLK